MKSKKKSLAKRPRVLQSLIRRVQRRRPVHKRILLHPISGFVLLCAGVLVAGSTFPGLAISYDVTAKVSAPALTQPAVMAPQVDQQHVSDSAYTVLGSCPDKSYVNLYREGTYSGTAICSSNVFSIQTT